MGHRWNTKEIRFSESQTRQIESNTNILHVSERSIPYQSEFKLAAIKSDQEGTTPKEIFLEAGFNLDAIGRKTPNNCNPF